MVQYVTLDGSQQAFRQENKYMYIIIFLEKLRVQC